MTDRCNISRHKTAMTRVNFSRPIQIALSLGLISSGCSVFDYGCGKGDDLRGLNSSGITCSGWDPIYRPEGEKKEADVVNLGYVINVIEDIKERSMVLSEAWSLTRKVLLVAARLVHELKGQKLKPYGDGFLTRKGTFQRYYNQNELREWIDKELGVSSVAVSPGIFIVFREKELLQNYLASVNRRRFTTPSIKKSEIVYENNKDLLDSLASFVTENGRIPDETEYPRFDEIKEKFRSVEHAFAIIKQVTNPEQWTVIANERAKELLINLALQRFNVNGRPRFMDLPKPIQLDVKAFFNNYTNACRKADELLFSAGKLDIIDKACKEATCGKLTQNALYIHITALNSLPTVLRIYEGCARQYVGFVEGANIIKLHRQKPKVSYLSYPDFDKDPHPSLVGSLVVPLQDLKVKYWDSSTSDNPPILHRKEEFVSSDYPLRDKFARLTVQEEKAGLYDNPSIIGRREQWHQLLIEKGIRISGHRLLKAKSF